MPFKDLICPECDGTGYDKDDLTQTIECYYCMGTGYATDDDSQSAMFSYEKDW